MVINILINQFLGENKKKKGEKCILGRGAGM